MPGNDARSRHDAALGSNLRSARERSSLNLREVQELSEALAQKWENPGYRISAAWLVRLENGWGGLSAAHLISLAAIYGLNADEMLELYVHGDNPLPVSERFRPSSTMLLSAGPLDDHVRTMLPETVISDEVPESTSLLPRNPGLPSTFRRAIIGRKDRAMEPMICAGSFVMVDTQRKAIAKRLPGINEFERPIYFLLTRESYLTGFCELDKEGAYLTLVPHPLSPESNRRWRFRKEVEVIGTVAGVATRRVVK